MSEGDGISAGDPGEPGSSEQEGPEQQSPERESPEQESPWQEPSLERSMFAHPEWTVGVVLIIAVVMLLLGILGHPIWLLIGSPFILVLAVWILVRSVERSRRGRASSDGP